MAKNVKVKRTAQERAIERKRLRKEIWKYREMYLFMLPALVVLLIFSYGPMYGIVMAFQDVKIGVSIFQNEFVGLKHFQRYFSSIWFATTLRNTVLVSLLVQILCWPVPLILALLLHNCVHPRLKKTAQNFSYLPHLLSVVVVVSVIRLLCDTQSGLINILLTKMGGERINFFADPKWVYPMYVLSAVWQDSGYNAIIYLGALSAVNAELEDAARIDGAGKLKCIWHIQLPCILPTIVILLILNMGKMLVMGADKMLLLQTDVNLSRSEIIDTYVYKTGIGGAQYGFATAVGMFQNVINLALVFLTNRIAKKLTDVSIF